MYIGLTICVWDLFIGGGGGGHTHCPFCPNHESMPGSPENLAEPEFARISALAILFLFFWGGGGGREGTVAPALCAYVYNTLIIADCISFIRHINENISIR